MIYSDTEFQLTKLSGGHSGAELYRLETRNAKYLLKVLPDKFSQERTNRIAAICKLYRDCGIRSLELIKSGKLKSTDQHFLLYNYIDGDNYENLGQNCAVEENYQTGMQVGSWLFQLKNTKPPRELINHREDINTLTDTISIDFLQLFTNSSVTSIMQQYYDLNILLDFEKILKRDSMIFAGIEQYLIHGDIKRSNVMVDSDGKLWLIDIESMRMSYDMLNFRHQMTWFLSAKDEKKMAFLRGVFTGLYEKMWPADFQRQIIYITLLNFCEYTSHHADEPEKLDEYFRRMRPIFDQLLSNEFIV